MDFEDALKRVLDHEGGYVNHPSDPGGETNFGITKRVSQAHGYNGSMRAIPMHIVRDIYKAGYWDKCRCDQLPAIMRFDVFDAAVNSGVSRSIRWLQQAVGAKVDGIIGPQTIGMTQQAGDVRMRFNAIRLSFLAGLGHWPTFGRGWARRVAYNLGVKQ